MLPMPQRITLLSAGLFLLLGLLCGVWKFLQMRRGPEHLAHPYVDTAHRAGLLYSFACLVMAKLLEFSPFSTTIQIVAISAPLVFFALAMVTYIYHGFAQDTDNQMRGGGLLVDAFMVLLIIAEIGGVGMLVYGFVVSQFLNQGV